MTFRERVRVWFKPPRRLKFTRAGALFTFGVVALGFATLNTGNNLLYLLLGALLGLIVISGWLSEQAMQRLRFVRRAGRGIAGEPITLTYEVSNGKRRLPSLSLEFREHDERITAFLPYVAAGKTAFARTQVTFDKRGVYKLHRFVIGTSYPFGLFFKERDIAFPGTIIVWPRTDRVVRDPPRYGQRMRRTGNTAPMSAAGGRGDFRSLRPYQSGDDPRDVHWRTSARYTEPVVREYDRDAAETLWLALDLRTNDNAAGEVLIENAASLAARGIARGERVGLVTNDVIIDPGSGGGQLDLILDILARAQLRPDAPELRPPVSDAFPVT
ncbi:MAG TPA: DUF58 domain-containing protein [Longimicrobiales bacterium]|nr:DUF58 domain-containing protein [Longimicrobiales bacterium]